MKILECSIALISKNNLYLFSKRKKNLYKDHYEFPGGALKSSESPQNALYRECKEELGIDILKSKYMGSIIHIYKELKVKIYIFKIDKYENEIMSMEGQELAFLDPFTSNNIFLESTKRILNNINLPNQMVITSTRHQDILKNINLSNYVIRIRSFNLSREQYLDQIDYYYQKYKKFNIIYILDYKYMSDFKNIKFHGLHFTSKELMDAKKDHIKIDKLLYSASCHNTNEISQANLHNLDFITLSPVLSSKNAAEVLGWKKFKSLSSIANMPVYALGGIKPEDIDMVHKNGGYGISGISNFLL